MHHIKVGLLLAGAATQGIFGKASVIAMAVNRLVFCCRYSSISYYYYCCCSYYYYYYYYYCLEY